MIQFNPCPPEQLLSPTNNKPIDMIGGIDLIGNGYFAAVLINGKFDTTPSE